MTQLQRLRRLGNKLIFLTKKKIEKFVTALQNDEGKEFRRNDRIRNWESDHDDFFSRSQQFMKSYIPPNIKEFKKQDLLTNPQIPTPIAERLWKNKILWMLRRSSSYINKVSFTQNIICCVVFKIILSLFFLSSYNLLKNIIDE